MRNNGFSEVFIFLILAVVFVISFVIWNSVKKDVTETVEKAGEEILMNGKKRKNEVLWKYNNDLEKYTRFGDVPECPEPLVIDSPVDVNLATSVLYPGQIRGTDCKPHGGFRFDDHLNNEIEIFAPMDGKMYQAARHLEGGEVQYALYIINDCGLMYKLDHLRELSEKYNEVLETIPMGAEGDSRTTFINPPFEVKKGDLVATKVGIEHNLNVFFDFGVYDLRSTNGVEYSEEFLETQPNINEFGRHAICWLEYLPESDKSYVYSLPGADSVNGKKSDYCN